MQTIIKRPSKECYIEAGEIIRNGGIVAFPTETVYGLGADATNSDAVKSIYEAKGRPQDNPLIVHLCDKSLIEKYAKISNDLERVLIDKCMPGPISLVLEKKDLISDIVTCGLSTVAIRIPENNVAREFIKASDKPICAPSANTSKKPSPTNALDVYEDMNNKIPLIIDGGNCDIGVESSVVRVKDNIIYILRPGKYSAKKLRELTDSVVVDKVEFNGTIPLSPGTKYAHYCPQCEMIMITKNKVQNIKNLYNNFALNNKKVIIFCEQSHIENFKNLNNISIGKTSEDACKNLFRFLRIYDKKFDVILCEYLDKGDMQQALFDRMSKSARGQIV